MVRGWSFSLGIGLVILGLAGLSASEGAPWVGWLDLLTAFFSLVIAATVRPGARSAARGGGPILLSVALFGIWLVGLTTGSAAGWMAWWNFAFGSAYALLGLAAHAEARRAYLERFPGETPQIRRREKPEEKPPRRVA